tara:strand:+ start:152 stop:865 length:714 start_codon:yes stop_codon:yes gene_type:complete
MSAVKSNKIVAKKKLLPANYEYVVNDIEEDYKYFDIKFQPGPSYRTAQNNYLNIGVMSFKVLFQFQCHENFEDSYYNKQIYLTEDILDSIIDSFDGHKILDVKTYKLLLFINVCKKDEIQDKYKLYDEEHDLYIIKNYMKYYEGDFSKYFDNRYKDYTIYKSDIMERIKLFNYHYDKIYPHSYNKHDNPKEYNKVSKNKSNLKTQYRKVLEGEDINTLNNIPALKMMIYIIQNIEIN